MFDQEIVPVTTKTVDSDGTERTMTVTKDDGIRVGTTLAGLAKLRPAFKPDGSTTAGESRDQRDSSHLSRCDSLPAASQVTPAR